MSSICKKCQREFNDDYDGLIKYCKDCHNEILDDPVLSKDPKYFKDTWWIRSERQHRVIKMSNGDRVHVTRFLDRKGVIQSVSSYTVSAKPTEETSKYLL